MNHNTIFTVNNSDLERLDPRTAVDFFRKLLCAEARRTGTEISGIHVPSAIHVPDGGIDATVNDAQIDTGCGIIKQGKTSYQIKSGAAEPWQPSFIEKELFRGATQDRQKLGESIRDCLDVDGTYVLVLTGIDLVESQRLSAIKNIKECLKKCDYPEAEVEVWSQNNLIGVLKFFPSSALKVTGNDAADFQTHDSWSKDGEMEVQFVPGESQSKLITNIQNELRRDDDTVHVRVLGEPGIGKTKLVLEATRTSDLKSLVIYCTASQFRDSYLMNQILRDDNNFSAVLVIDECDADSRYYIWDKLRHRGSRIKLITIYNDHDPISDRGISEFKISSLDDDQIRTIIQGYNVSTEQANRYLEFSGGSPRMAHHVGRILESYPGDPSRLLTDDYLYKSFYIDFRREDPDSQEIEQRELVLQYIALFKKFGFERSVVTEAQAISKKVEADNPLITWSKFQKTVDNLKRKILQGEFSLYLTPKGLHIKLWTEWWRIHGNSFDLEEFTQDLPPKLIEWFYEMFVYSAESEATSQIVKDLLGLNGPFQNDEYLKTKLGGGFFLALTEANPKYALNCLSCTVGTWNRETLLQFKEGRREVILALEKIAVWRELFADAAKLLLALAEAENEGFSNNASGVFAELFSPGPGRVAPTEAPPSIRLPILEEAFASGSKERRALALKACNYALESTDFVRFGSPENQGLRQQANLWMPKTYGELWDAYKKVWELLDNQLARLPDDGPQECAMILLGRAREIAGIPDLTEMVVETVATIAKNRYLSEKRVIETVSHILHYDSDDIPAETRGLWQQLMDELITPDFQSMMKRYVGMDLLDDEFDEDGIHVDQAQPRIEELAKQALDNVTLLQSELNWLVTTEAEKGYHFGHELGKRDSEISLLPTLLKAQRNAGEDASAYFLGGYLRALFEAEPSVWEAQLDALINDAKLRLLIPELTYRSGLTNRAGLRLLDLAKSRIINVNHFGFFAYGQAIKNLSSEVFSEWITFLLSVNNKNSVSLALNFFHRYHVFQIPKPILPFELTFRLITHPALFKETDESRFDTTMTAYYWAEISRAFLHLYPERNLELAELMLSHFGEDGSIVSRYSKTCSVLDEITEKCPAEIWKQVSRLLENHEYSSKKFALEQWLREGSSWGREETKPALLRIPHELIWDWIGEDTEYRAWYFANRLVPKTLSTKEWEGSLVRGLLIHYGEREDVRNNLCANYTTETYWGPASLHYEEKIRKLLDIKNCEDDWNVTRWIDEFVEQLKRDVEQAKVEEERLF